MDQSKSTLVMLSGGLTSLYVLVDLLENTHDNIYTHYVHLKAHGNNSIAALQSCQQIVDYCNLHYREFKFSQSMLDYHELSITGIELMCVAYNAALAAQPANNHNFPIDRCLIASNKEKVGSPLNFQHFSDCFAAACFPNDPPHLQQILVDPDTALKRIPFELLQMATTDGQ